MHHALLLSPDDQAVSAITAVLEEMSVTCERPLDGPSAAKKLTAQSFDLVLVDCENLPAAKLIFDVCRRSQTGTNPVPIAIVDGRAGLPTAFRLGAELILTKPVAKDQARTTIRTAISRVKKEEPAKAIHPFEEPAAAVSHPASAETLTHAAAAGAVSSVASPEKALAPMAAAPPAVARMNSATEEITAAPSLAPKVAAAPKPSVPVTDMFMPAAKAAPEKPADDPILADLESDQPTPVFTSYTQLQKKRHGPTIVLFLLLLACFGFYAAWMYQPGFRETAQPLITRFLAMLTGAPQQTAPARTVPAPVPVKPPTPQPAPATTAPPADATAVPAATSAPNSAPTTTATSPTSSAAAATVPPSPAQKSPEPAESNQNTPSPENELPGEKSAVILSSQGAEKRLIHHMPPVYPADAQKKGIEGTVVLKTVVSAAGAVEGVRVVEGNPALTAAAIRSVKQWRYRPYLRDGKAQSFQTIVLVEFQRP